MNGCSWEQRAVSTVLSGAVIALCWPFSGKVHTAVGAAITLCAQLQR
jgi:hypothetical protein